ncbi:AbrB/MazE/SpoVT family DNA-binding domain-containing protein [Ancylobacter vacuolatus]
MRAVVKKWGNSASVRIPAAMLAEAGLSLDQPVDIRSRVETHNQ